MKKALIRNAKPNPGKYRFVAYDPDTSKVIATVESARNDQSADEAVSILDQAAREAGYEIDHIQSWLES